MTQQSFSFGYRFSCASILAALCLSLAACSGAAGSDASDNAGDADPTPSAGNSGNIGNAGNANGGSAGTSNGGSGKAGASGAGSGNAGSGNGACAGDPVCASLNGLGVDTNKTPRVGPAGGELPASFNPFGGKVTALYPKQELYIGGLSLGKSANNSAIVERHADLPQDPASNVMFQAAEAWTKAALHAAVAGDFDGDGRQEIAGLYVKNGALMLHTIGNEKAAFATADVTLGQYEVSALGAAAGDFDGDGKDEIAIAIAQTAGTKLLFAEDAATLFEIDPTLTQSLPRETAGATLDYRLAAGNLDYDGAEELVLVANETLGAFQDGKGSAHYFVYDDQNSRFSGLKDGLVQGKDGAVYNALLASPAVIDVDADGVGEVVLAGLTSHEPGAPVEMILIALDDAAQQFAPLAAKHTSDDRELDSEGGGEQRYENVLVNGLDFDGDLAQDIQVNQVVFSNFSKSSAPFSKLFEINPEEFQTKQGFEFRPDNATLAVGDMNGDKHDDIVALSRDRDAVFIWGFQGVDANKKPLYGKID
ncbi:MAG: VCBS repeat-containing protein, partial [Polyangiaceae bacterium]